MSEDPGKRLLKSTIGALESLVELLKQGQTDDAIELMEKAIESLREAV